MTINTERLKTDAAYWDEVDDTKSKATHYCIQGGGFCSPDYIRHCDIPRPTKPDAPEWDGEGLPPKGADLEYDTHFGNWCPAKCIARGHDHSDPVAVIQTTNRIFIVSDSDRVRIRRTKRQRIGDALAEIIAKEIEIEFIDGNFHIETSSAIDYILSEYNLEPKQ